MFVINKNLHPTTDVESILLIKDFLKLNLGWSVVQSCNGTIYSTNDLLLTTSDFANLSWFIIRQKNATREILFQKGNASKEWKVIYSVSGFPLATSTSIPISLDNVGILDLDTNNFTDMFPDDGTYTLQISVDNEANYGFYFLTHNDLGNVLSIFAFDPIISVVNDSDPYVFYFDIGSNIGKSSKFYSTENNIKCWNKVTNTFSNAFSLFYCSNLSKDIQVPNGLASDYVYDTLFSFPYCIQTTTLPVLKGISTLFRWNGVNRSSLDTFYLSDGYRLVIGDINMPWDGYFQAAPYLTYVDFLLDNEPDKENTTYNYTPIVNGSSQETWVNSNTSFVLKQITYNYNARNKIITEVREVFDIDGVTILARLNVTYNYTGDKITSISSSRVI